MGELSFLSMDLRFPLKGCGIYSLVHESNILMSFDTKSTTRSHRTNALVPCWLGEGNTFHRE